MVIGTFSKLLVVVMDMMSCEKRRFHIACEDLHVFMGKKNVQR